MVVRLCPRMRGPIALMHMHFPPRDRGEVSACVRAVCRMYVELRDDSRFLEV